MPPDHHSPENSSPAESHRIEQRLRALQPRPTTLEAESVLREAGRQQPPAPLVDGAARPSQAPSTPWLALAAAGSCGAVAGAAVTWLVMLSFLTPPTPAGTSATGSVSSGLPSPAGGASRMQTDSSVPAPTGDRMPAGPAGRFRERERVPVREITADDTPQAPHSTSEWLSSESVALRPWTEPLSPHMPGERLVAGNHLPLQSRPLPSSLDDSRPPAESLVPMMDRSEPRNAATETLTLDPDGLLQELLGTPTGSTL